MSTFEVLMICECLLALDMYDTAKIVFLEYNRLQILGLDNNQMLVRMCNRAGCIRMAELCASVALSNNNICLTAPLSDEKLLALIGPLDKHIAHLGSVKDNAYWLGQLLASHRPKILEPVLQAYNEHPSLAGDMRAYFQNPIRCIIPQHGMGSYTVSLAPINIAAARESLDLMISSGWTNPELLTVNENELRWLVLNDETHLFLNRVLELHPSALEQTCILEAVMALTIARGELAAIAMLQVLKNHGVVLEDLDKNCSSDCQSTQSDLKFPSLCSMCLIMRFDLLIMYLMNSSRFN